MRIHEPLYESLVAAAKDNRLTLSEEAERRLEQGQERTIELMRALETIERLGGRVRDYHYVFVGDQAQNKAQRERSSAGEFGLTTCEICGKEIERDPGRKV